MNETTPVPSAMHKFSYAGTRLLNAIETPVGMDGAGLAARQIRGCIQQASQHYGASVHSLWVGEARNLCETLRHLSDEGQASLMALSESADASDIYKKFAKQRKSNLPQYMGAQVDAAFGVILIASAVNAASISEPVISAFHTFHNAGVDRKGRHVDWMTLTKNFPTSLEEVEAWAKRDTEPRIQKFMDVLAAALRLSPTSPEALAPPVKADVAEVVSTAPGSKARDGDAQMPPVAPGGKSVEEAIDRAPPESLVGWLRSRADQAGYRSRFGADGRWERHTKDELIEICKGIRTALVNRPDFRGGSMI